MQEAQTSKGWKVWGSSAGSQAVDFKQLYVNRDLLQNLAEGWLHAYPATLEQDAHVQAAFLWKFAYIHSHS